MLWHWSLLLSSTETRVVTDLAPTETRVVTDKTGHVDKMADGQTDGRTDGQSDSRVVTDLPVPALVTSLLLDRII